MFNPWDKPIKKMYGPYIRKGYKPGEKSRRAMVAVFEDDTKTSMSYARWLMTQHLGRVLAEEEHVDHIDDDQLNDVIENLQILTPEENNQKSNTGKISPLKGIEKGFEHGTVYGFLKKKCKCDLCESFKKVYNEKRNAARRSSPERVSRDAPVECGSLRSYNKGCKCDRCRAANAKYSLMVRNGTKPKTTDILI